MDDDKKYKSEYNKYGRNYKERLNAILVDFKKESYGHLSFTIAIEEIRNLMELYRSRV